MKRLWYKKKAEQFTEALPIGNGRLGAMVYGGTDREKISLNEDTLWSGFPKDKTLEQAKEGIEQAKKALRDGKVGQAEQEIFENCLGEYTDCYLPAGNMWITTKLSDVSDYERELNIENAVCTTSFQNGQERYKRKTLISSVDDIMAVKVWNENSKAETEISLEIIHPHKIEKIENKIIATAVAPYYCAPCYADVEQPVRYDDFENNRALTYVIGVCVDKECEIRDEKIIIKDNDFSIYVDVETNFESFDKYPQESKINPRVVCMEKLDCAVAKGYEQIEKDHIKDYGALFSRVVFELEGVHNDDLPTDERMRKYQIDPSDVGLHEMVFDYGRYLTIASSRKGTQATNLQGIWNEELRAPWSSNYTININTQMNYWHVEAANLSECHLPLIDLIEHLSVKGTEIARKHYGCNGWCSHHNTDLWGSAGAITGENASAVQYGFWPMSGAWLCRHIWEHYEYTKDKLFLEKKWNTLKNAALFLLDWMEEREDGNLTAPISTSPENAYLLNGEKHYLSQGTAMDQAIACDLFSICLKASAILGKELDFFQKVKDAMKKMNLYTVGNKGQILEWDEEYVEAEPTHRHLSLLYGVYPGNSITKHTPVWIEASKKTMELRGDEATGWSFGWKACVWARLGDGNRAKKFLDKMLRLVNDKEIHYGSGGGMYMNMFCAHPPFQIDGNFGITAAICEMLLQYDGDKPVFLPAVPNEWKHGKMKGIKMKGGKTTDVEW